MNWPEGIEARPMDKGDVEAWAALTAAKEKVDQVGENYSAEDLAEQLERPELDLAKDSISLWSGGRMIGYGIVHSRTTVVDVDRVNTEGTIDPEWRRQGLGTTLMRWLIRRAGELHAATHPDAPGQVGVGAGSHNVSLTSLLEGLGFKAERFFFDMRRPLDQPVPPAPVAGGLQLRSYDTSYEEALRQTHFEAFSDHWGWTPPTTEAWRARNVGSRAFRGAQSYYVLDGDTIAAYANCYEWEADTEATGVRELYIGQVGTRRAYRGRGLARAALAKVLAKAAEAGYQRAALGVDADNPTGALGLYEGLGFVTHQKFISYALPVPSDV
ncbi:mycothiol synthase [Kribbella sp. VKM Ac-2571]|uniref:GNAT family N-acetyltransferase n=1 Tax=Kribbella sp. VKM Ac-2571 TaxID=2512222 RepID=UPI00105DAD29|nr:GNAT family N-acetyltransferase [Kribbella sp. VKM Ac-2571]TDO59706.1 mycothiol synthase [Kribbella sp. VKM Ac-2571]